MNKKNKKSSNKIPKAFFVSLIFSVLFWSLITLSKDYTTLVAFPVEYSNLPQDRMIQESPLSFIDIQVKSTGFRLIKQRVFSEKIALDARNLKKKSNSKFYFLLQNQKATIQNRITNNYLIDYIVQDTVFLSLGILTLKKVPVVSDFEITYKLGYQIIDKLLLKPDSVLIKGPEGQVEKVNFLKLEKLSLNDVSVDIQEKIKIVPLIDLDEVTFATKNIEVVGKVDRFTEGSLELPFEIINLPDSLLVSTFPKTITVVYQVGLSNFNNIDKNSFKIICDYQHSVSNNLNYLVPKIMSKPSFASSVNLNPKKIEFLIQK